MKLRRPGRVLRIGHRGAPALAPENTIPSLSAALEHGVDLVELDVLRHGAGLRLGHSSSALGPGSPSLGEALTYFSEHAPNEVGLIVDLKSRGIEEAIVEALRAHGLLDRALAASFDTGALRTLKSLEPGLRTGFSYPYDRAGISGARLLQPLIRAGLAGLRLTLPARIARLLTRARADAALLHHALVSTLLVERCHARGAAVLAWTVEDARALERVLAAGVDGVIVNDPRLFDV